MRDINFSKFQRFTGSGVYLQSIVKAIDSNNSKPAVKLAMDLEALRQPGTAHMRFGKLAGIEVARIRPRNLLHRNLTGILQ